MIRFLSDLFKHRQSAAGSGRPVDADHRREMAQRVVDDSADGIAVVNRDGLIELLNPAAERILGKRAEDLLGTPSQSCMPWNREIEELYAGTENRGAEEMAAGPDEFSLMRDDGVELVIELRVSSSKLPVTAMARGTGAEQRLVHVYTFRDVTERRRVENAQTDAIAKATAASRAKSEFLANMSHELRTPLNAVIGFAEVIKAQHFGPVGVPQYAEYVEDIFQSGHHLLALINDILDMSKIEAGEMRLTEAMVNIPAVAGSCLRLLSERAHKGKIAIAVDVPDDLPWLRADERMVKQMVLNLLTNAVKFTPPGGHVTIRAEIDAVDCLVVSINDTGVGIAPEQMDKVLRPFGQADTPQNGQQEGTGLGLPLVKAMAELHGALLVIDSTPNKGTTAAIRFPVARVTARTGTGMETGIDNRAA